MAQAGISTLGLRLSWGVETVAGEKPTTFTLLDRINSIGGITIEPETIDASALEDEVERSVAGRGTTGGTFPIGINVTDETIDQWENLIADYKGMGTGLRMWFQISSPYLTRAYFVAGQPPLQIPMPDFGQNELLTAELPITIDEYVGMDEKVEPTE
jgi:hypothetical protein